eukprot:4594164-Pleurochrysis_carterae.AAC.1
MESNVAQTNSALMPVATGVKMEAMRRLVDPLCTVVRNTAMVGALAQVLETMNPRQIARGKPDQEIHEAAGQ